MSSWHRNRHSLARPSGLGARLLHRAGFWPVAIAVAIGTALVVAVAMALAAAPQAGETGQAAPSVPHPDLSDLRWTGYHGYQLPVSARSGPRAIAAGLARRFADTPAGALLAAVNIAARSDWQSGPGVFGPTIERQVTGPDAMALLQDDLAAYRQGSSRLPGIDVRTRPDAYKIISYTPRNAVVGLVQGAADGGASVYAVTVIEVRWIDADWRVLAPPGGQWTASQIPSPAGYTAFPGR